MHSELAVVTGSLAELVSAVENVRSTRFAISGGSIAIPLAPAYQDVIEGLQTLIDECSLSTFINRPGLPFGFSSFGSIVPWFLGAL